MTEPKLCKDCDYSNRLLAFPNTYICERPVINNNFVTGPCVEKLDSVCGVQRECSGEDYCGIEAKFFKPRRSFWKRLLRIG